MNFSEDFSERLKEAMRRADLSQKRVSEHTGIRQSALSTYCAGKGLPNAEALYLLAVELGVTMEWLIAGQSGGTIQNSEEDWQRRAQEAERRAEAAESKLAALQACAKTLSSTVSQIAEIFISQ